MEIKKEIMEMLRPGPVSWGRMQADPAKCDGCERCVKSCPRGNWEVRDGIAYFLTSRTCTSCFNCTAICPVQAITALATYHVDQGFFKTEPHPLPARLPEPPRNAAGEPDQYTALECAVLERRSTRSFKPDRVPDPLLRRVLEAGRFAPSGANCQPWRFMVITDPALLSDFAEVIRNEFRKFTAAYDDDRALPLLAQLFAASPNIGMFDPRAVGTARNVAEGSLPVFLNAPALILILMDERAPAPGGIAVNTGIAGQNMGLVANSLGLGACWSGLSQLINLVPQLKDRLGIQPPWQVGAGVALGYPAFPQHGMVPREKRPVTWFRPGLAPQVES